MRNSTEYQDLIQQYNRWRDIYARAGKRALGMSLISTPTGSGSVTVIPILTGPHSSYSHNRTVTRSFKHRPNGAWTLS